MSFEQMGPERSASVRQASLAGRPREAGAYVVDAHAHIGPWFNFRIPDSYAEGMLRTMDQAGIDEAWIAADASIGPDCRLGNALVAQAVAAHPTRFRGYITVSPHYPAETAEELARRYDAGWRLVKLHPGTHQHPADGPGYRTVWEFAQERRLHILSHSFQSPAALSQLATTYPDVTILVGHAAASGQRDVYAEIAARQTNVYLDLCSSTVWRGVLEQLVERASATQILYGSDIPFIDPRPQLGRVAFAHLDDDVLRAILGGNARRIWQRFATPG